MIYPGGSADETAGPATCGSAAIIAGTKNDPVCNDVFGAGERTLDKVRVTAGCRDRNRTKILEHKAWSLATAIIRWSR
jgi:hypothetical protein